MTPLPLGFPSQYLQPLQTALGPAWPRPRVRRIMEGLENVQKRMTVNQQMRNGIMHTPKAVRQARFDELAKEFRDMEAELGRLMEAFKKEPVTKEQFKRPDAELSECCNDYVRKMIPDPQPEKVTENDYQYQCLGCRGLCSVYKRLDREDWTKEYQEIQQEQRAVLQPPVKREEEKKGLTPGWLIT